MWNTERERESERQLENLNGLGRTSANSELSTLWLDNGTISGELEAIVPQAIERNEWKNNEIKPKKKKKKKYTHKRSIYWPNDKDAVRFYSDTTYLRLHFLSVQRARKKNFMNELYWYLRWRQNSFLFRSMYFPPNLTESIWQYFKIVYASALKFSFIFRSRSLARHEIPNLTSTPSDQSL